MPIFSNTDITDYLSHAGFVNISSDVTNMVFIRQDEALVFFGINITYKQKIGCWNSDINAILFKWPTVKKFTGFDQWDINGLMMILHVMGAVPISKMESKLVNESKQRLANVTKMLQAEKLKTA